MENFLIIWPAVFLVLFLLYKRLTRYDNDFKDQGIAHEKPLPILGNTLRMFLKKEGIIQLMERNYKKFNNEKVVGFYGLAGTKFLIPRDPKFIKQITIKDFDYFVNRDGNHDLKVDPLLSKSILYLRDQKWKDMRTLLTPIYTSSRIKYMYGLLTECMDDFISFYEEKARANGNEIEIETHDVYARTTADGIATTALGFKGDCVRNKDSKIFEVAENSEKISQARRI